MKKNLLGIALLLVSVLLVGNVYAEATATKCSDSPFTEVCEEVDDDNNVTITLKKDLEADGQIAIKQGKNVTFNLNGHNLTIKKEKLETDSHNTFILLSKGSLTITGKGTVKTEKGFVIGVVDSQNNIKSIKIDKDVIIETTETDENINVAINLDTSLNTTLDVYGTVKAKGFAINVNGQQKSPISFPVINIHDGAKLESTDSIGMYLAGYASTTIGKATIIGKTGIGIKSGRLTLNGTTIKATGQANEGQTVTGGMTSTGAAIQVEDNEDYKIPGVRQSVKLNINGGNYTSEHNSVLVEYGETSENENTALEELAINDAKFESGRTDVEVIVLPEKTKLEKFISGGQFIGKLGDDFEKFVGDGLVINADGTVAKPVAPSTETTNPGEKDDAPETNDIFPMALVGMIALGLAGTYTLKKLHN